MMNLKDVPIQRKLTTIILMTSSAVLLLTCAAFMAYEFVTFRKTMVNEMETMADVVSANSIAAIAFKDKNVAREILSALKADKNILLGALYDSDKKLYAQFPANEPPTSFPKIPEYEGHRLEAGHIVLFHPMTEGDRELGTLYLKSDLAPLYQRLQLYGWIVVLVMSCSFALAYVMSLWLQKSISKPILDLAETAQLVSEQRNYLVRADKYGRDEVGKLTEAFNHMLAQIHERDLALRASQERLKLALSASQTGIWDWDLKSNLIGWDEFSHVLFGLKPGMFSGNYEDFLNMVHPQDRAVVSGAIDETLNSGKELNVEFKVTWPDSSSHQLTGRGKAICNELGRPVRMTGVYLDVTERKRAEEQIRTLNAELEQRVVLRTAELTASTREMEAFTYSVSHDLRAPLRHIVAFAEIVLEDFAPKLEPVAQDYLKRIMYGARSMSQLVDDLLNLARIGRQELSRQPVDLNLVLDETLADLKPETEDRKIEWKISPLPQAECDPGLIKQVFANLLSNAIKYSRPREEAIIEIGQVKIKGEKAIFVRDNGVGFNMKFADKLFGVFQRLHRAEQFEGTGVGLATVERIVHKHGGHVWAEAELDKGAVFYFTFDSKNSGNRPRMKSETTFVATRDKTFDN